MVGSLPLNQSTVHKFSGAFNLCFAVFHSAAVSALIYYRVSFLFRQGTSTTLPWLLVFTSELLLFFIWILSQATRWKPISRTAYPDRLSKLNDDLPSVDVFICTADPEKEPTLGVMNTVLSAMSLDYPVEKLNVYLSDDAGSLITLAGMREACKFAKWWVPFCRKYRIRTCCPEAYFLDDDEDGCGSDESLHSLKDKEMIKEKYEEFKKGIERCRAALKSETKSGYTSRHHPASIEVVQDSIEEEERSSEIPLLVYVAREKDPSQPHHFKAGALNVLLRVSGLMSNSPYILGLDCDMYCNDRSSAKQAMCFHLDPKLSPSLSFVVFPQRFRSISKHDIYDSQLRSVFETYFHCVDGLKGPCIPGTNYYIKRESLYAPLHKATDVDKVTRTFGPSHEFVKSLRQEYNTTTTIYGDEYSRSRLIQETRSVASCSYEDETKWGKQVGFWYNSVVEDYITSFILQCNGWRSVYVNPSRPQFMGTSTTNLNDVLVQGTRWSSGLVDVAFSSFCPLLYGPPRMSFLQSIWYSELAFFPPLYALSLWCFAMVPQLCLLHGISLFPEVSSPFFKVYSLVFISAVSMHLHDVLSTGGSLQTWINEQRIWMMKSVTCHLYGSLDAVMKKLKLRQASFITTNKASDDEQTKLYQAGVFDFRAPALLVAPLVIVVVTNVACLVGGLARAIAKGELEKMLAQMFISGYIVAVNYAVLQGMIVRKDKGRIEPVVSLLSAALAFLFLILGSVFLAYCSSPKLY